VKADILQHRLIFIVAKAKIFDLNTAVKLIFETPTVIANVVFHRFGYFCNQGFGGFDR
jgi:hypothetical protein